MTHTPHASSGGRLLFGLVIGDLVAFGMLMPLLPSYATRFGASPAMVGVLVAAFSVMLLLFAPAWGRLSDRIGRRPVLLLGFGGSVLASLLFAWADSVLVLLLSRLVAGGLGATVNVAQAYYADVTPPAGRTRAMGLLGAAYGVGFIFGPAIGGAVSVMGDAWPGYAAAAFAAVSLILGLLWLPEPAQHTAPAPVPVIPASTASPALLRILATGAAATMAFTVMYVVFPLYAEQELGYDRRGVSWLFVLVGLVNASAQGGLVGRLVPRFGEGRLMTGGSTLMAVGFVLLPLGTSAAMPTGLRAPAFFASLVIVALGYGLVGPAVAGSLSRAVDPDRQGRTLGLLQSANAGARVAGPILAGVISQAGGPAAAFLTSAAAAAVAGLLSRGTVPRAEAVTSES